MEQPITMKDLNDFLEKSQNFQKFSPTVCDNRQFYIQEYISEIVDEIQLQVINWYDNSSDYPKPEDILVDYLHCTQAEAHKFLPLFTDFLEK